MSCRVIGRTVETVLLSDLAESARAANLEAVEGWIVPTKRNLPVRDLYERHGFRKVCNDNGRQKWRLNLSDQTIESPKWVRVQHAVGQ